ncbi:MAG TPA: type IV secretion system DNA-binding domain-containing protein [Candidatus Paceibacterota bacterium]|nr:type IV secretion system DNA-binding domain-containing protein [Candidatus Paceibacterota bacterium]
MPEDNEKITYFAKTNSRGKEMPFGIKRKDRARHMYIIGKTGMGKSTLLENMAIQDVRNGEGMAFIDPHGSTADRIMEYIPEHRIKDVLYFAPFDMDYPVAFNVMEDVGYDKRHLVVSGLLSAFRKIWVDAWSARMEYILSNTLLALLEYPGATLLDVNRMLVNKAFRKKVVEKVTDPIVKSFWMDEFANYTDRYTQDATPAIQNKVGQFTSNPLIRNIVGQPKSSFDIRKMMDEKKIIIMNLSKGKVGEVNATLLGSMLVTKIYLAAMSRADVPASVLQGLPSFYFYVDEFQSFSNQSFADILSEARKYKLNLIIAHQYIEQMEEEVRNAVFGNVGTTIAFRVGPFDAEVLETIFSPQFTATDLVNLGFAQVYLTLMINGVGSPPFSATTLPPFDPPPERYVDKVLSNSRAQFGKHRTDVEEAIKKWHELDAMEPPKPKRDAPRREYVQPQQHQDRPPQFERPAQPQQQERPRPQPGQHSHDSQPVRSAEAKIIGESLAHKHDMAGSKAMRDEKEPKYTPPLDGAKSLREALSQVTGQKFTPTPVHAPDLKDTLHSVAPQAQATPHKPAELPEKVLREMLAVDEPEGENS